MIHRALTHALGFAPLALLAFCPTPANAQAHGNDCAVAAPSISPDTVVARYDPFDAATTNADFAIDIVTTDCPANRNFFLELDPVDPTQSDGTSIRFVGPGGVALTASISDARGGRGHGRGDFFNVKSGAQTFYLTVPFGQIVPPGDYSARILAAARLNNGANTPDSSRPFDAIIRVGAAIGLAPATGTGIDLGTLGDGDHADQPVTFDAYANVPYRLQLRSDYGFVMRRGGVAGAVGPQYSPLLDDVALSGAVAQRDFTTPPNNVWRRRHSLDVQVPSIAGLPAGTYRDYVTVEISARLGD
jgi:hypothetical protein